MKNITPKLTLIAMFIALTGCTTNVDLSSKVEVPAQFEQTQNAATSKNAMEISRWWQNWHDPQLTQLIEQGLKNNLNRGTRNGGAHAHSCRKSPNSPFL